MGVSDLDPDAHGRRPWNAGNTVGAKRPLKPRDVWAIRFFLDEHRRLRDRALFDLAIDSKLRGCDIIKMKIGDIVAGGALRTRATVIQQKTHRPVQFELMTEARKTLLTWLTRRGGTLDDFIFPSRVNYMGHLSTRQYARLIDEWVGAVGFVGEISCLERQRATPTDCRLGRHRGCTFRRETGRQAGVPFSNGSSVSARTPLPSARIT